MKDIDAIKMKFKEMDILLREAEKELEALQSFTSQFESILQKTEKLDAFYRSDTWEKGREVLYKDNQQDVFYYSAGEDPIWNLTQDLYNEKIKIVQAIIKTL